MVCHRLSLLAKESQCSAHNYRHPQTNALLNLHKEDW